MGGAAWPKDGRGCRGLCLETVYPAHDAGSVALGEWHKSGLATWMSTVVEPGPERGFPNGGGGVIGILGMIWWTSGMAKNNRILNSFSVLCCHQTGRSQRSASLPVALACSAGHLWLGTQQYPQARAQQVLR